MLLVIFVLGFLWGYHDIEAVVIPLSASGFLFLVCPGVAITLGLLLYVFFAGILVCCPPSKTWRGIA